MHEFALAGLPLLLSDCVGSAPAFLINGYNGFVFRHGSSQALAEAMLALSVKSNFELLEMGQRSHALGTAINPKLSAASFCPIGQAGIC